MATLSFEGETHDEIVRKVRRWLASLDDAPEQTITPVEANSIVYEMNAAVAKQLLRTLRG